MYIHTHTCLPRPTQHTYKLQRQHTMHTRTHVHTYTYIHTLTCLLRPTDLRNTHKFSGNIQCIHVHTYIHTHACLQTYATHFHNWYRERKSKRERERDICILCHVAPQMPAFQQLQVWVHVTSLPCKSDFSVWERIKAARSAAEEPSIYIYIYAYYTRI